MSEIVIRDITIEDIPAIRDVVRDVWAWEAVFDDDAIVEACVAMYFAPVLHEATFGKVAALDGTVVGVIFGVVDNDAPCFKHLSYDLTPYIITLLQAKDSDRQGMCEYTTKQLATYKALIHDIEDEYDGTLDFLALSKAAQGKGIGKLLWLALKTHFEEKNVRKVYLFSDNECNFGFYESQGFTRRRNKSMCVSFARGEDKTEQYLYEYMLDGATPV